MSTYNYIEWCTVEVRVPVEIVAGDERAMNIDHTVITVEPASLNYSQYGHDPAQALAERSVAYLLERASTPEVKS